MADDPRDFMRLMVQKMKEKFDKYWNEFSLFMIVATILDPRNKLKYIKYAFVQLYGEEEAQKKIAYITNELHTLFDDYAAKEKSGGSGDIVHDINASSNEDHVDSGRVAFENWVKTTNDAMPTRKEIDVYLDEGVLLGYSAKDWEVLGWCKENMSKFRILSKMARDILSIPVTTVPSESAFSAGRRVISDDRCSLGDDTIEGLLCASNWFRHEFEV